MFEGEANETHWIAGGKGIFIFNAKQGFTTSLRIFAELSTHTKLLHMAFQTVQVHLLPRHKFELLQTMAARASSNEKMVKHTPNRQGL